MHTAARSRRFALRPLAWVCGLLAGWLGVSAALAQEPVIVIDTVNSRGRIRDTAFGANHRYDQKARGTWDSAANEVYPGFLDTFRETRLGIVRFPAGTIANLYHWKRAIGPFENRTNNAYGRDDSWFGTQVNHFGPDEYGAALLEKAGVAGVIVVNFATGNADEAADWVEYMNAPNDGSNPRGGVDWAAVRAANGHPEPYDIRFWEVGNEFDTSGQNYWLDLVWGDMATYADKYAFGGSTTFSAPDRVVEYDSYADSAAVADGTTNQVKYVPYPPVDPSFKHTIFVDAQTWTQVVDLSNSGPNDPHYTLDRESGKITFGDGQHGRRPPSGSVVTATYRSGAHDGFTSFVAEMKAVDPDIRVYASLGKTEFAGAMGTAHAYDGIVRHFYPGDQGTVGTRAIWHDELVVWPKYALTDRMMNVPQMICANAGPNAKGMDMAFTEYGEPNIDCGEPIPGEGNTMTQALYHAMFLQHAAEMGLPMAMKHMLTNPQFKRNDIVFPTATNPPEYHTSAIGLAFGALGIFKDTRLLAAWTSNNPAGPSGNRGQIGALQVMAARGADDALLLLVTNATRDTDVTAAIRPLGFKHTGKAEIREVNGPSHLSNNDLDHPDDVSVRYSTVEVAQGDFTHRFPAHSITVIRLERSLIADFWKPLRDFAFDQPSQGTGWYPSAGHWWLNGQAEVIAVPAIDPDAGYVLHLTGGTNHGRATLTLLSGDIASGIVWASFDVWADDRTASLYLSLGDDSRTPIAGVALSHDHDGLFDPLGPGGGWTDTERPYYRDAWIHVDLIADIDSGVYDVWIDNYKLFLGEPLPANGGVASIRKLTIETGTDTNDAGEFYVDNVRVRHLLPPATPSAVPADTWRQYR